jgi:hypothetical protein
MGVFDTNNMSNYVSTTAGGTVVYHNGTLTNVANIWNVCGFLNDPGNATPALRGKIRINGGDRTVTNTTSAAPVNSNPWGALTIGCDPADQGGAFLTGYVAEIILVSRALSGGEITQLESYLNTKWAIY